MLSQASPAPSLSVSNWLGLATAGQLSTALSKPSPSVSLSLMLSQASPAPSLSVSNWLGLATAGQLSTTSSKPSPSVSLSLIASQASPTPSLSVSNWLGLAVAGQLSWSTANNPLLSIPSASGSNANRGFSLSSSSTLFTPSASESITLSGASSTEASIT